MRLNKFILSIGVAAMLISCSKSNLEVSPPTSLVGSAVFTSVNDLEQGMLSAYAVWSGENTMYINAILSDEVKLSSENRGQGQFEFKWQYSSGTETFGFSGFYSMVRKANLVLEAASGVTAKNSTEEARKQSIIAEALAIRGLAHFELLQRYGPAGYKPSELGVSYIKNVLPISAEPSRNTVAEVIAAIEKDLSDAKSNTALSTAPQLTPSYGNIRINKAFIAGIQARVALYKKDWVNAETYASEAITTSGKTLATGSTFAGIWTDAAATSTEPEVLLRLRRTGNGVGTLWQDTNGDVFFEPSDKLKQQFDRTNDIRFNAYFLINAPGPSVDTALIKKFFQSSRGPKIVDVKVMRVAEMYLIRAEARAEQNKLTEATNDINTLRSNRINSYAPIATYADKASAIADILNERFKELCYEGFRFFDLKRRELTVTRNASDVTSSLWLSLPAGNFRFALPIPQSERFANPNQTQNTGY